VVLKITLKTHIQTGDPNVHGILFTESEVKFLTGGKISEMSRLGAHIQALLQAGKLWKAMQLTTKNLTVSSEKQIFPCNRRKLKCTKRKNLSHIIKDCKKISIMTMKKATRCLRIIQINVGRSLIAYQN